jgi:hypothetical protein
MINVTEVVMESQNKEKPRTTQITTEFFQAVHELIVAFLKGWQSG